VLALAQAAHLIFYLPVHAVILMMHMLPLLLFPPADLLGVLPVGHGLQEGQQHKGGADAVGSSTARTEGAVGRQSCRQS
jgi:hypothetical protein